ncbi:unnamed protein product [Rotaria magnacalcarata]|uniref:Uncharacterized protein n=8 Tax=Rotaria magnacalcarata TaxID=392030 RepID=A0A814GQK2_9BILA|nr:unnamed protein product [Rotaria magnacalcarata]
MLRFKASASRKVNARRIQRCQQRKILNHLFDGHDIIESDDEINDDNQSMESESSKLSEVTPSSLPLLKSMNYENDQFDNVHSFEDHLLDTDSGEPLFDGSLLTINKAVRQLCSFFTDANINKRAAVHLLRIIKTLLPKPNRLPTSWKGIMKVLGHVSTSRTTFLCSNCFQQCQKGRYGAKLCQNEQCSLKNRTMKSSQIVELVHLDIRTQIQSILTRNQLLLNRKDLYPMTDVCFGEFYQNQPSERINRITLIIHVDGASLVKLSKQSIWPCFASIVELPPPAREYQKNIVLLSLWTSKVKPDPNIFLQETIEELKLLIDTGTSIFINGQEYEISFRTQYFVSDLPAKALFCKTINFNGYSACTECCSTGEWSAGSKTVVYPFTQNNLTPRTHATYLDAAKEAQKKSIRSKTVSVNGIKGLSTLLQIFEYPRQIVFDYMHLVCLGHVPSVIKRWCQQIDESTIRLIDSSLSQLHLPHNLNVPFLDSIVSSAQWKAKNSRLFVLNVGVPIVLLNLPKLLASHFLLYSTAVKILHAPESVDEINLTEQVMNYYCKTAPLVHGPSIELYSLHAHIHLAQQVKRHGGLGHTSAFAFESCIRFIERKAHGSTHLGTQIAYWIDLQTIMQNHEVKAPTLTLINEIKWLDGRLGPYHTVLTEQLAAHTPDLNSCNFYIFFHKVMYTENTYAKPYLNRRTNTENVLYNLVLFPSDNSITVVKAKQCSPAENDGFILVQSGKKKFMGVVLEEGTLLQCSEAADRLTKKTVHPEIESDYERNVDKIQSKQNNTTTSAISTLKAVPFTEQNSNIQQRIASTITVSSGHSGIPDILHLNLNKCLPCSSATTSSSAQSLNNNRFPKENDSIPVGLPAATLMSDDCSSVSRSILESKRKNQKRTSNLKHKRRKQSPSGTASIELLDQFNNTDDESDDSEDEQSGNSERYVHPNQSTTDQAPSFVGRPVIEKIKKSKNKSTKISSSVIQQLLSFTSKLESQYLKPILIAQDRLETMTKNLFVNQKKMEKVLRKQKMNISLNNLDDNDESTHTQTFRSSMEYKLPGGVVVDLLQKAGVKEHANLYVTHLMDILFNPDELLAMETKDVPTDERYILLKEAVRNKFRLTHEELETMWIWLHNVILAKRRTISAKRRNTNEQINN